MRPTGERGVGLIEALVAVSLLSVVAAGLGAMTVGSTRSNYASRAASEAAALVTDQIEVLRSLDPASSPPALTSGNHLDALNPITAAGTANGTYTRAWTVTANTPANGLSRVAVRVSWASPVVRTVTGVTYVCMTRECI